MPVVQATCALHPPIEMERHTPRCELTTVASSWTHDRKTIPCVRADCSVGLSRSACACSPRLEDGSKTQVNWLPALGWNAHDELLAGFVVHNSVLPLRNWEWMAMPLWSTENATLAGIGRVSFKKGNGRWEGKLRKFATQGHRGGVRFGLPAEQCALLASFQPKSWHTTKLGFERFAH